MVQPSASVLPRKRLSAFTVGLAVCAGSVLAQDTGGVVYTFGFDQSLRSESNPGLENPAAPSRVSARTLLRFGALTETRNQRLEFLAQGTLAANLNSDDSLSEGLIDPAVSLAYQIESAASLVSLSAFLRERDVDTLDFLLDADETGETFLTSVSGTGVQRQTGVGMRYEFGRDAALGGSFALNRLETDYYRTTDPSLADSVRNTARLALRYDLSPATRLTAGLSASRLDEVDRDISRTDTLSFGVENDRPNGLVTVNANLSDTDTGGRQSLTFGRSLELPAGQVTARVGVSNFSEGGSAFVGGVDWQQDLPRGRLTLRLSQEVTGDENDTEILLTRLSVGYAQDLSANLTGSIGIGLQNGLETETDILTRTANLSANVRYALTEDWGLTAGASHRIRDEDGNDRVDNTLLTLSIGRTFQFRP